MMKKNRKHFLTVPILVVLFTACTTTKAEKMEEPSGDVQNSRHDPDRADKQYAKEVEVYRASAESDLRENKLKIAKIQDQKTVVTGEALVIRNEKIAAMRKKNDELELRMRQYRADNKENWQDFKRDFDNDMIQLENSLRDLKKEHTE